MCADVPVATPPRAAANQQRHNDVRIIEMFKYVR